MSLRNLTKSAEFVDYAVMNRGLSSTLPTATNIVIDATSWN